MNNKPSITTALSLGATIAIMYSLCALAFALIPGVTAGMIASVSHGVNLTPLEIGKAPFSFGDYLNGLVCVTLYAIVAGYVYGSMKVLIPKRP